MRQRNIKRCSHLSSMLHYRETVLPTSYKTVITCAFHHAPSRMDKREESRKEEKKKEGRTKRIKRRGKTFYMARGFISVTEPLKMSNVICGCSVTPPRKSTTRDLLQLRIFCKFMEAYRCLYKSDI